MNLKRTLALALVLGMLISGVGVAQAYDVDINNADLTIKLLDPVCYANSGTAIIKYRIENNSTATTTYTLQYVWPHDTSTLTSATFVGNGSGGTNLTLAPGSNTNLVVTATLATNAVSKNGQKMDFVFAELSKPLSTDESFNLIVPTSDDGSTTTTTEAQGDALIALSPTDGAGNIIAAPKGNYGDTIRFYVPVVCRLDPAGAGWSKYRYIKDIRITPVFSTSLDEWPFEIEAVDYSLTHEGTLSEGNVALFEYRLKLSKKVTSGVKKVGYAVSYRDSDGKLHSTTLNLFVTVVKGAAATVTDENGQVVVSTPKLMLQSASTSVDKIYAGDSFELSVTFTNTSTDDNISNISIRCADSTNTILPVDGGTNTIYIDKIAKGESVQKTISLQAAPDSEPKVYNMSLECEYESGSTKTAYKSTESVSFRVQQRIRLKFDDPVIYDDGWVDQTVSMECPVNNLGKSTVYNFSADVEGEGLKMAESYYGGNITSGSTLRADISIIPSVAGDIDGNVVFTYEDAYGETFTEKVPFKLFVNEDVPMDDTSMDGTEVYDPSMDQSQGMPVWLWIVIGVVVAGGVVTGIILLKRKRAKELIDE